MITEICTLLDFPSDVSEKLEDALASILGNPSAAKILLTCEQKLFEGDYDFYSQELEKISQLCDIHRFTVDLVFLLYSARALLFAYRIKGFDDELFCDTMRDLKYKLRECNTVYGIDGTFVLSWYGRFYQCKLFALGRLEYGINTSSKDIPEIGLKKGDRVFDCHIPSSGEPFTPENVLLSLKKAYGFFKQHGFLTTDHMIVTCHSYLLYPPTLSIFPQDGNVVKFAKLFVLSDAQENTQNSDFWRIFGRFYDKDRPFDSSELKTSMQKNFAKYLSDGNNFGTAFGYLVFDGSKIL